MQHLTTKTKTFPGKELGVTWKENVQEVDGPGSSPSGYEIDADFASSNVNWFWRVVERLEKMFYDLQIVEGPGTVKLLSAAAA